MTPGRLLAAIGFAAVVVVLAVLAICREADALRGRASAVEANVADVDAALARHAHDAWEVAEAYRQRCYWSMVPAATRRGLMEAVLIRPARGEPVVVSIAR